MNSMRLWSALAAASLITVGMAAAQPLRDLPTGPNRDLVLRVCEGCHDIQMVLDTGGLSREDWEITLNMMGTYGMQISDGDRALILTYLATFLPERK
jgi:hypothetical protein